MFCSKCGKDLPDGTRFCPKCGTAVTEPVRELDPNDSPATAAKSATTVKERPPKDQKRTALLIALFAVVLVAAVILVLFRIMNTEGDSSMPSDDSAMTDDATLDDDAAEQDPGAELLAILDQVEAVQQETNDAYSAVYESEDIEVVERYRQMAQIYKSFVADLDALRVQADAVNGLDAKLKAAKDEYFTMLHDARTAHAEMIDILADYLELSRDYLQWRPSSFDYDTIGEYSEAYIEWAQNTSDAFAAISYPACVEDVWKRYGVVLEYNEYIAAKIALANQSGDWLRYYSTKSLESLCGMMDDNQYRRLYNCLEGERDHANNQFSVASALAGEIRAYTEMTPEEKDAYEFAYIRTGKIIVNYDVVDTIYPSLYNTYDAFAIFKTGCISGKRTIIIEAEIEGFTQQYRESFNLDSSYKEIYIKPPR